MTRSLLLLLVVWLLSGCAVLKAPNPGSKELAATLIFIRGDKPLDKLSGIASVGNYNFPALPVRLAHIVPGNREIGYMCPGYIYLDAVPVVEQTFEGGKSYVLSCHDGKLIIRTKAL